MVKRIYMGTSNSYVNQRLAKLVINEQLQIWDNNDLLYYKSMYLKSKAWLLLKFWHSQLHQQHTLFIMKAKINLINN